MQRLFILLFLVAVGVGVYLLVTSTEAPDTNGLPTDESGDDPAAKGGAGELKGATGVGPDALPHVLKLEKPARVLLIAKHQASWPALVIQGFQQLHDLEYRTWYLEDVGSGAPKAGDGRGMAALQAAPTDQYLLDHEVDALFLDTIDPNALPESFWNIVADRVGSGRMGLYVRPAFLVGDGGEGVSEHPMLTHPILSALLPVKQAALIQGSPLPGVFPEAQPLRVTPEGTRHPASRLVANETASGKAWARTTEGDGAFATKFCYPVMELTPDAQALVELQASTSIPAIIATIPGDGTRRVLWMGNADFGQRAYFVQSKDAIQKVLVNHWVLWLTGQMPAD